MYNSDLCHSHHGPGELVDCWNVERAIRKFWWNRNSILWTRLTLGLLLIIQWAESALCHTSITSSLLYLSAVLPVIIKSCIVCQPLCLWVNGGHLFRTATYLPNQKFCAHRGFIVSELTFLCCPIWISHYTTN